MKAARVFLREPKWSDRHEFLRAMRASRTLHGSWTRPPRTQAEYRAFLKRGRGKTSECRFVRERETGAIVGVIHLGNIVRGLFQSGYLGYYGVSGRDGRGYMTEGMSLMLRLAFRELKLHRVEANIQPGNRRSIALVKRLGFKREGYSPRYLKIAGRWRDHERWALTKEDWKSER